MSDTETWTDTSGIPAYLYSTVYAWLTAQYCETRQPRNERFVVTLDRVDISLANCCALYALGGATAVRSYLNTLPNPYDLPFHKIP